MDGDGVEETAENSCSFVLFPCGGVTKGESCWKDLGVGVGVGVGERSALLMMEWRGKKTDLEV